MNPRSASLWACLATLAPLALNACGTYSEPIKLTRSDYPYLPSAQYSECLRAKCETNEGLGRKLFWGNYGGPGGLGGEPTDELDWLFYQHDVAYLDGVRLCDLRAADRLLIRQLKEVDADTLSALGQEYRLRTIRFFRNPISRWVGKPRDVLLRTKRGPTVAWE